MVLFLNEYAFLEIPKILQEPLRCIRIPIGSVLKLCILASEDPLVYKWYFNQQLVASVSTSFFAVSTSADPTLHDGEYYCSVSNWKGVVFSNIFCVRVSNEDLAQDPCADFKLDFCSIQYNEVCAHVRASTGMVLAILEHVCILSPNAFTISDWFERDISNTVGVDIALSICNEFGKYPDLAKRQAYRSSIVTIRPNAKSITWKENTMHLWICHNAYFSPNFDLLVLKRSNDDDDGWMEMPKTKYR